MSLELEDDFDLYWWGRLAEMSVLESTLWKSTRSSLVLFCDLESLTGERPLLEFKTLSAETFFVEVLS